MGAKQRGNRKEWGREHIMWPMLFLLAASFMVPIFAESLKTGLAAQKRQVASVSEAEKGGFEIRIGTDSEAEREEESGDKEAHEADGNRPGSRPNGNKPNGNRPGGEAGLSDGEKRATPSEVLLLPKKRSGATGDLWEDWNGTYEFEGTGDKENPYQIRTLSELMGLSEQVAAGRDFAGEYFELQNDIDLGNLEINGGNWNPIGWYQNVTELSQDVRHPFRGHFDGAGNTIYGLKFARQEYDFKNVGLFGVIDGGSVEHLNIEAEEINGSDNAGLLAGAAAGGTRIYDVTVSGCVYGAGDIGGLVGEVSGGTNGAGRSVLENCRAESVVLNSEGRNSFIGGIAGNVQNADIVDSVVTTQDGDADRIQGKGYVGGIAGRIRKANIYNAYVSGTIGGNLSVSAGGILGKYESGNLIVARFAGEIGRSNNGAAAYEGTFVGMRDAGDRFTYGTEKGDNLSYLFADSAAAAKIVFGNHIDGDNTFTKDAHIGCFTDLEKKYKTISGKKEIGCGDRYFYEELEDGVRHIITQKLGNAADTDHAEGAGFAIDHFAPGAQGEPVRGYLLSVPRIDAKNDNGTFDTDVAVLSAMPVSNNSYYRKIDKDNPAAVAAGDTVAVTTAPKNDGDDRYQMVYDEDEAGLAEPPTYVNEAGERIPMGYVSGGSYTFTMPACDTEINVKYVKVTTKLTVTPAETVISVTQRREGDRKSPRIVTEVKNEEGSLIARYIDGEADSAVEVQSVSVQAKHNGQGSAADRSVKWSVDDADLLINVSDSGYTETDGKFLLNMDSAFLRELIAEKTEEQADGGYREAIDNTVYEKSAVVTAATNPATSVGNKAVYGNCRVNVRFQILDQTTVRVEGLLLNRPEITLTLTRTLTGDRKNPKETYTAGAPVVLSASLTPSQPFFKNVSWKDEESGKLIAFTPKGTNTQECEVTLRFDEAGKNNPAWIQNIINQDDEKKAASGGYRKLTGTGSETELLTAVSEDRTHGTVSAQCRIKLVFKTDDRTEILPEDVAVSEEEVRYELKYENGTFTGFEEKALSAKVLPKLSDDAAFLPFDRGVLWESSDAEALTVGTGGVIKPRQEAKWITDVQRRYPYKAEKEVTVTARARGKESVAKTVKVKLSFVSSYRPSSSGGSSGGSGGGSASGAVTPGGSVKKSVSAPQGAVTGTWVQDAAGNWLFTGNGRTYASEWAYIHNPYASETQSGTDWFRFDKNGYMQTGWYLNDYGDWYYLNPVSDNTRGRMFTGWNFVDGAWRYFDTKDGDTLGRLLCGWQWLDGNGDGIAECYYLDPAEKGAMHVNGRTPDGYTVDGEGRWTVSGTVQERKEYLNEAPKSRTK